MYRQRIEKLVGKNAPGEIRREALDPFDTHAGQQRFLMRAHRRTPLENPISKPVLAQNVAREHALPCAQLDNREVIEAGRNLQEVLREEAADNRSNVR